MRPTLLPLAPALLLAVGCGDVASSSGELGRLDFTLVTAYEMPDDQLVDLTLLTGFEQHLDVDFTSRGLQDLHDVGDLRYAVVPEEGVALTVEEIDPNPSEEGADPEAPDLYVTVTEPGTYVFQCFEGEELFDEITLPFDRPVTYEVHTWARDPDEEAFADRTSDGPIDAVRGTQVALLPIPLAADGTRLSGELDFDLAADPEGSIVEVSNVLGVYEQSIWWSS